MSRRFVTESIIEPIQVVVVASVVSPELQQLPMYVTAVSADFLVQVLSLEELGTHVSGSEYRIVGIWDGEHSLSKLVHELQKVGKKAGLEPDVLCVISFLQELKVGEEGGGVKILLSPEMSWASVAQVLAQDVLHLSTPKVGWTELGASLWPSLTTREEKKSETKIGVEEDLVSLEQKTAPPISTSLFTRGKFEEKPKTILENAQIHTPISHVRDITSVVQLKPTPKVVILPNPESFGGVKKLNVELEKTEFNERKDFQRLGKLESLFASPVSKVLPLEEKLTLEKKVGEKLAEKVSFWQKYRLSFGVKNIWRKISLIIAVVMMIGVVGLLVVWILAMQLRAAYLSTLEKTAQLFMGQASSSPQLQQLEEDLRIKQAQVQKVWMLAGPILPIFNQNSANIDSATTLSTHQLRAYDAWQKTDQSSQVLLSTIMGASTGDVGQLSQAAQANSEQASKETSQLSADVQTAVNEDVTIGGWSTAASLRSLQVLRRNLASTQRVLSLIPELLGVRGKKTYVVLIQNPLELRATGGYLSAVILLSFDHGVLVDVQARDSYELDKSLLGKVDAPPELTQLLEEKDWSLRESNWSPDFPTTARQAEWFVEKETNKQVDGTVAINAFVLRDLLQVLGPVKLASYGDEEVTAQNILERLQVKNEVDMSGESSSKKGYLTALSEAVFTQIQKVNPQQLLQVVGVLGKSAVDAQLVFSVSDPALEKAINNLGWNGRIMSPLCPPPFSDQSCFVDTAYQVDTNVGVNRANYYVQKSMEHSVILSSEVAAHTLTLRYTNNSPSSTWPAGTYKNFIRVYVPEFSDLVNVQVDGQPLPASQVGITLENGRRRFSFLVQVPPGKQTKVEVNYITRLSENGAFSYALFIQKQPGTDAFPTLFTISVQKPLQAKTVAPEANVVNNVVQYDITMGTHQFMAVELVK